MQRTIRTASTVFVPGLLLTISACQDNRQQSSGPGSNAAPNSTTDAISADDASGEPITIGSLSLPHVYLNLALRGNTFLTPCAN